MDKFTIVLFKLKISINFECMDVLVLCKKEEIKQLQNLKEFSGTS